MKKTKILMAGSIAAAMLLVGGALPVPNAGAASASDATSGSSQVHSNVKPGDGKFGRFGFRGLEDQLLQYLKLDETTFKEKIKMKTLAEIAQEQNITREDLKAQLVKWMESNAATKTNKQGQTKTIDYATIAEKWLDAKGAFTGKGDMGNGMGAHHGIGFMHGSSEELAAALGLTTDKLQEAMKSGKTLASIAAEQNVDVTTIINLLVEKEKEQLATCLKDGKITQTEYDSRLADVTDRVTKMVNGQLPDKSGFGHRGSSI
ncbi:hypothetical protein ACFQ3W_21425 [Paenibacillus puldeungensis]|uniref:LysM domain-containing protein n=1 Tax=Paenibacillus puldeungensis TaxID=696536 RepID=A0ABW3S3M8_9BACL